MGYRVLRASCASLFLAAAMACAQSGQPISPSAVPGSTEAAADGSTLKVTAPSLVSPVGGVRLDNLQPEFAIGPATGRFTSGTFQYEIEVQTMGGQIVGRTQSIGSGSPWKIPSELTLNTRYRWRARATMGNFYGPWAQYGEFLSLEKPPYNGLVPRPPNGAWPTTGPAVVAYVASMFPELLLPTALTAHRIEHMEFLRDRVIEAGVCGGLDLARNLKRNIGPHSHDAIAWRKPNGFVEVVDIAAAFDDKFIDLVLHWQIVDGPSGYDPLPNHPGC